MPSIRDEVAFDKRTAEAHRIRAKYPNRIPVICEKATRSDLPEIDKKKFLVPMNMLVGEFKYIIHKHINQCAQIHGMAMTHEKTIYLFVNNTAPKAGALIQEVYEAHMADDGFLYIEYSCENTLGRSGCDSCCLLPTGNYHDNLCDTTTTTTVDSRRRGCR
eukprot:GHVS01055367.1.p1 GENE.GHVS01055367.1~~GHVS01055367.1.p1  ORF type:complete len:161 (+),score=18.31 GHVS01055367.1:272-754(+)